jgi:hypothetical protein
MSHTPSSSPDDEPTQDFEVEYIPSREGGFIGIFKPRFNLQHHSTALTTEEQQLASYRYMMERYGMTSPTEWQARILRDILERHDADPEAFRRERSQGKAPGVYNQMIHRQVDGSDPLVQEPGP